MKGKKFKVFSFSLLTFQLFTVEKIQQKKGRGVIIEKNARLFSQNSGFFIFDMGKL